MTHGCAFRIVGEPLEPARGSDVQEPLTFRYIEIYIGTCETQTQRRFRPSFRSLRGPGGSPSGEHHQRHGRRFGGRRGHRLFDYGELRLLALAMIAGQPRHGYELMKAIEDRMGGSYSPSPGVIYPTLSWLEDMGYAAVESEAVGRKRYRITGEGEAFLAANRPAVEALLSRTGEPGAGGAVPPRCCAGWRT